MMINEKIINAAMECASRSNMKYRMSSIIYDNDENILASGFNFAYGQSLTARISNRYLHTGRAKWSVHAEGGAVIRYIKKYNSYPRGLNMFVFRGNKYGEPRLAKPCSACSSLIDFVGIKKVEYSK